MNIALELNLVVRRLRRSHGFSLVCIAMLTLGIALSVGMFSVVRGVLLGALPYPDGDLVVVVRAANPQQNMAPGALTPAEAMRLRADDRLFERFGFYSWGGLTVFDAERPREFTITIVSDGFFPTLATPPALGRWFDAADFEDASDAIVLSHGEWQRLFGGDPSAIGRAIETSDGTMRVVGVMPADFGSPLGEIGAFRPWRLSRLTADKPWFPHARFVEAIARRNPARGDAALAHGFDAALAEVRADFALPDDGWRLQITPMLDAIVGTTRPLLWSAFGLAVLVLLIACANVAVLVDARQVAGRHEQAVAQAIGASRARIYRGLLLEIAVLAVVAAALGCLLATLGVDALRELARDSLPRVDRIAVDGAVLAVAGLLALLLPFATALAGTLRVRAAPAQAIRSGGKGLLDGTQRVPRVLPTLSAALSTISLVAAVALLSSLWHLQRVDPGFHPAGIHGMLLYRGGEPEQRPAFTAAVLEQLRAIPGVDAVALSTDVPFAPHGRFQTDLQVRDRERPEPLQALLRRVSPDYLRLLQIPLRAGRGIDDGDRAGSEPVVVINQTLARQVFGEQSPLGQQIGLPLGQGERIYHRVVGVMADQRNTGLRTPPQAELLTPYLQQTYHGMTFLVRSAIADGIDAQMVDALWRVDPRQSVSELYGMQQAVDDELRATRFFVRTVGAFAVAALLLAAFGIYAVASLQQRQRITEFGLRLAIGARPWTLARQIIGGVLRTAALGIALGLLGGWAALRLLQPHLFGIDGGELAVVAVGVGAMLLAALLAGWLPARRASRTDPMQALRGD